MWHGILAVASIHGSTWPGKLHIPIDGDAVRFVAQLTCSIFIFVSVLQVICCERGAIEGSSEEGSVYRVFGHPFQCEICSDFVESLHGFAGAAVIGRTGITRVVGG